MKPGFFSLFKRGRYFRPALAVLAREEEESPSERKQSMAQCERFAVAAIAFTLEHSPVWRQTWWEKICKCEGDPDLSDAARIEIEPANYADLLFENPAPQGNFVYVVECKIGAELAAHQNPSTEEFWGAGGYGWRLRQKYAGFRIRYCVLGVTEKLKLPPATPEFSCTQWSWHDVESAWRSNDTLVSDLFNCLGSLGIAPFKHQKTNQMKAPNLSAIAQAYTILQHTAERLEVPFDQRTRDVRAPVSGSEDWCVGVWIDAPKEHQRLKGGARLKAIVKPPGNRLAWFGYAGANGNQYLTIELYCGDRETADALRAKLSAKEWDIRLDEVTEEQPPWFNLVVTTEGREAPSDRDLFLGVFEAAGMKLSVLSGQARLAA